jgi:DNA-binding transcriptional regulator GbsR (MarR family)
MKLSEAKQTFIQAWGTLGVEWGINRTMAQIHALLLCSPEPLDTETIMEQLQVSRGNANVNLRSLVDWGLVTREIRPGVRREFFAAAKDVWEIARAIAIQRRRRELDPMMRVLSTLEIEPDDGASPSGIAEVEEFRRMIHDIHELGAMVSRLFDLFVLLDQGTFSKPLLMLLQSRSQPAKLSGGRNLQGGVP